MADLSTVSWVPGDDRERRRASGLKEAGADGHVSSAEVLEVLKGLWWV